MFINPWENITPFHGLKNVMLHNLPVNICVIHLFSYFFPVPATLDASTIAFSVKENGDLVLNWRVPLGDVDYYEVTVTPGDLVLNITANTYTFTSLEPSTTHTFSIKTFTGGFESTGTATENRLTGNLQRLVSTGH